MPFTEQVENIVSGAGVFFVVVVIFALGRGRIRVVGGIRTLVLA